MGDRVFFTTSRARIVNTRRDLSDVVRTKVSRGLAARCHIHLHETASTSYPSSLVGPTRNRTNERGRPALNGRRAVPSARRVSYLSVRSRHEQVLAVANTTSQLSRDRTQRVTFFIHQQRHKQDSEQAATYAM